jgi:hypothetical protein
MILQKLQQNDRKIETFNSGIGSFAQWLCWGANWICTVPLPLPLGIFASHGFRKNI